MRKIMLFQALTVSALLLLLTSANLTAQTNTHAETPAAHNAEIGAQLPPNAATPISAEPPQTGAPQTHDETAANLSAALDAYLKGDAVKAMDYLWVAQEELWRKAPLSIRNVAFVTEQPENFGTYKPKDGETFKSPELMILYCEPTGFTQLKEGDTYRYSLIGGFDILNDKGEIIGSQRNLGPFEQHGYRTFSTETMLVFTIGIQGLPAGSYSIRVILTDNLDPTKSVQIEKPFKISE